MAEKSAYAQAGVDIAAGHEATQLMKAAVQATYGPEVLSETGSFGGLFAAQALQQMDAPVLVASTDGVGTKTMVAAQVGRWDTIGRDIVNHCINDILVQGARPLFFLDYVASSKLEPQKIAAVVGGAAAACQEANCALLGGETAEMPGVYQRGELDLVGTVVGMVERGRIIDGSRIEAGDAILALPSSGLHTNGFTLARHALSALDWQEPRAELDGQTVGDVLLTPHRCYLNEIQALLTAGVDVRGLSHITGGGLVDNPPRIFPDGLGAEIELSSWQIPAIFELIQQQADVASAEMFHVFNMGLGMLIVLPADQVSQAQALLGDDALLVGQMVAGSGVALV